MTVLRRLVAAIVLLAACLGGHPFDASATPASAVAPTTATYTYNVAGEQLTTTRLAQSLVNPKSSIVMGSARHGNLSRNPEDFVAAESGGGILANQAAGNAARDAIAARYAGSSTEVGFETSLGAWRVDVLTQDGLAIESKVGRTSLTGDIQTQIAKDQLLVRGGQVNGVQWQFTRSAVTGQIGPTGPLGAALDKAGIPWTLGP